MITTIVADYENHSLSLIERQLKIFCPQLTVSGLAHCSSEACQLLRDQTPSLAIIAVEMPGYSGFDIMNNYSSTHLETIFIAHSADYAMEAVRQQVCGYVLKPVGLEDLLHAVKTAEQRIMRRQLMLNHTQSTSAGLGSRPPGNLIGIPSMKGFDFIQISHIIRCESLLKCTRIITTEGSDILSSYNIGEFSKQLESHGFFSTHRSHFINLSHVKQYYKEGTVRMIDDSYVPVAKRRKSLFLKTMLLSR